MLNSERLKSISYSKQAVCVLDVLGFSNEIKMIRTILIQLLL